MVTVRAHTSLNADGFTIRRVGSYPHAHICKADT